eukprot:TRINITY_DN682_c0_g3_i1.p1 TRINITY_DN682_c0_g3~~TRINITY_DN682_c0_g3_i1.p1  ORF type:complete len:823 (+),score=184.37 TRINITY_DN682_c0_g3_i1:22-2469(+)
MSTRKKRKLHDISREEHNSAKITSWFSAQAKQGSGDATSVDETRLQPQCTPPVPRAFSDDEGGAGNAKEPSEHSAEAVPTEQPPKPSKQAPAEKRQPRWRRRADSKSAGSGANATPAAAATEKEASAGSCRFDTRFCDSTDDNLLGDDDLAPEAPLTYTLERLLQESAAAAATDSSTTPQPSQEPGPDTPPDEPADDTSSFLRHMSAELASADSAEVWRDESLCSRMLRDPPQRFASMKELCIVSAVPDVDDAAARIIAEPPFVERLIAEGDEVALTELLCGNWLEQLLAVDGRQPPPTVLRWLFNVAAYHWEPQVALAACRALLSLLSPPPLPAFFMLQHPATPAPSHNVVRRREILGEGAAAAPAAIITTTSAPAPAPQAVPKCNHDAASNEWRPALSDLLCVLKRYGANFDSELPPPRPYVKEPFVYSFNISLLASVFEHLACNKLLARGADRPALVVTLLQLLADPRISPPPASPRAPANCNAYFFDALGIGEDNDLSSKFKKGKRQQDDAEGKTAKKKKQKRGCTNEGWAVVALQRAVQGLLDSCTPEEWTQYLPKLAQAISGTPFTPPQRVGDTPPSQQQQQLKEGNEKAKCQEHREEQERAARVCRKLLKQAQLVSVCPIFSARLSAVRLQAAWRLLLAGCGAVLFVGSGPAPTGVAARKAAVARQLTEAVARDDASVLCSEPRTEHLAALARQLARYVTQRARDERDRSGRRWTYADSRALLALLRLITLCAFGRCHRALTAPTETADTRRLNDALNRLNMLMRDAAGDDIKRKIKDTLVLCCGELAVLLHDYGRGANTILSMMQLH